MNSFRKHATAMMAVFSVANTVVATAIAQPAQAPVSAPTRPGPMPPRPAPAAPMTAPQIESNPCQAGAGHSAPRCALRYMRETSQRKLTEIVGDGSRPTTLEQMRALDQIVVRLAQAQVASNLTPGFDPAPFLEWWRVWQG